MVKWVKPTGEMTPARPDAAVSCGNATQGAICCAVCSYALLGVSHIGWWWWLCLKWLRMAPAMTTAAAEARVMTDLSLWCANG